MVAVRLWTVSFPGSRKQDDRDYTPAIRCRKEAVFPMVTGAVAVPFGVSQTATVSSAQDGRWSSEHKRSGAGWRKGEQYLWVSVASSPFPLKRIELRLVLGCGERGRWFSIR
jgi:hypothetical protein